MIAAPRPGPGPGTAFARALAELRAGAGLPAVARALAAELDDRELLGLVDGDPGFWSGALAFLRHGYGRAPQVGGAVPRLGIPGLRFTDGPRGVTLGRSTCFPVAMARGATWDPALEEEIGLAMGREARAQGANCIGAVCINLLRHPAWGRAQETFGENPVHVGAMGAALVRGLQRNVMACAKHFALNSIENARFEVDVEIDEDVLHEVYLPHWKRVVDAGARVVMSAYNAVNGTFCGDNATLLTDILRDEWGFSGFVISDWVWGLRDPLGSLRAGLDVEMPFRQQRARALPAALASGVLGRDVLVRAATRIVGTQLAHEASLGPAPERAVVACEAHRALARRAAARAMVLLRNAPPAGTAGPVLPLAAAALSRVAVIGRLATSANLGDRGSSNVHPPAAVTPLEGLRAALPAAALAYDDGADAQRAAAVAAGCDVAIVVAGYRAVDEGEYLFATDSAALALLPWPLSADLPGRALRWGVRALARRGRIPGGDRARLTLRQHDEALIARVAAANPRTVVVVIAGSAVIAEAWRERVPAIVLAWYPGMEGGHALADVLLGRAEPGGRLPFVVPTHAAHLPDFDRGARRIRYDRWHGHEKLARDGREPAYPLGFGLGYTRFALSALRIDGAAAVVEVANLGERAGAAIVQLYAAPFDRPVERKLVGFSRVELAAGAAAPVTIEWTAMPLSRRDRMTRAWYAIPGRYRFEASQWCGDPSAAVAELVLDRARSPAAPA